MINEQPKRFVFSLFFVNGKLPSPAPVTTNVFPSNSFAMFVLSSVISLENERRK